MTAVRPLVLVGGFKHELYSFARGTISFADVARAGYFAEGDAIFDASRAQRPELAAIQSASGFRFRYEPIAATAAWDADQPTVSTGDVVEIDG